MKITLRIASLCLLALTACRTVGVEISQEQAASALGLTEAEVRDLYGVPNGTSSNSAGVETLSYDYERCRLWHSEASSAVKFTLTDGTVTGICYSGSHDTVAKDTSR